MALGCDRGAAGAAATEVGQRCGGRRCPPAAAATTAPATAASSSAAAGAGRAGWAAAAAAGATHARFPCDINASRRQPASASSVDPGVLPRSPTCPGHPAARRAGWTVCRLCRPFRPRAIHFTHHGRPHSSGIWSGCPWGTACALSCGTGGCSACSSNTYGGSAHGGGGGCSSGCFPPAAVARPPSCCSPGRASATLASPTPPHVARCRTATRGHRKCGPRCPHPGCCSGSGGGGTNGD